MGILKKKPPKDLPKTYTVTAFDMQREGEDICRQGDNAFVSFADAANWIFKNVPPTYSIHVECQGIPVMDLCLFGLEGELLEDKETIGDDSL